PLPAKVRQALAGKMIGHRSAEFSALLREITAGLRQWFQTEEDVLVLTASGTGGMEAALVNVLSPGDRVLAVSVGVFGERFADIARAYGADVTMLEFPWGQGADTDVIAGALSGDPDYRAVLVTHNETSTGVTNNLAAIAGAVKAAREEAPLLIVDAVSSLGAIDVRMDAWGCDVVVTSSQKALMTPPGLSFVALSARAWEASERARMPRFYWDLRKARVYAERVQTPFTPAVTTLFGLREALRMMAEEGRERVLERHRKLGRAMRLGIAGLELDLFAEESHASDTVTAVRVPSGRSAEELIRRLRDEHDVVVAGGQGRLKGRIIRIAHMGHVNEADVERVIEALRAVLGA
ncbi:MAG: alanine--glyoxylate aminotransferase family protein, partial [Anaerolineae bacterium]|nr:alanine--glyoxylate aminotransferase family protein [Anaerolineae bacterium]